MSTVIAHGFRFRTSDFSEVDAFVRTLRTTYRKKAEDAFARKLADDAIAIVDAAATAGFRSKISEDLSKNATSPMAAAWDNYKEIRSERIDRGYRSVDYDFSVQMVVMFHDGQFYGLLFTEQSDWRKEIFDLPLIEHLPYWNNTDPPSGVSDEAWRARGDLWDAVLGPAGIPSEAGFTATIVNQKWMLAPALDVLVASVPDFDQRVNRVAREIVINHLMAGTIAPADLDDFVPVMRSYRKANEKLRDDPMVQERERLVREMVSELLPRVVTVDLLQRGISPAEPGSLSVPEGLTSKPF